MEQHREQLLELNVEYASWVVSEIYKSFGVTREELIGMPIPEYVASMLEKVSGDRPPAGAFYLVMVEERLAGMGGLRRLAGDTAELKRIYIRAQHRGRRLGDAIVERLLSDAREFGYSKLVLDTGPFMRTAQRLYENAGFVDRPPYAGVEVPATIHHGWRFMQLDL